MWGTGADTEAKYLSSARRSRSSAWKRVEFKTDAKNDRAARRWPRFPPSSRNSTAST